MATEEDDHETEGGRRAGFAGVALILGIAVIVVVLALTGFNPHGS